MSRLEKTKRNIRHTLVSPSQCLGQPGCHHHINITICCVRIYHNIAISGLLRIYTQIRNNYSRVELLY